MKLNLGCGRDLLPGYLNIDIIEPEQLPPDVSFQRSSCTDLSWTVDGGASLIRAKDIIDHVPWRELNDTLLEWRRVLSPGGELHILNVPDFEAMASAYLESSQGNGDWEKLQLLVDWLSFPREVYRTKNLLSPGFLSEKLRSLGFENITVEKDGQ